MRRVEQPDTTSHGETPDLRADISLLNRAARAFNGVLEPRGHLRGIIEELREALHADGWSLWISDAAAGNAVCSMAEGLNGPSPPVDTHIAIGEGPVGWTLLHQTTLAVADVRVDRRCRLNGSDVAPCGINHGSLLCTPLLTSDPRDPQRAPSVIGALMIVAEPTDAFDDRSVALLEAIATIAAMSIENSRLRRATEAELAERRRVELALRHSEARYRTLFETSPDAIVVVSTEGAVTMCNRKAQELYGYDNAVELLGRSVLALIGPDSRAAVLSLHRQALEGRPAVTREVTMLRSDGTTFEAEYAVTLVAGQDGSGDNIVSFARDITDRLEAETTIRRHNEELRTLNAIATQITQARDLDQVLHTALVHTLDALHVDTGWIVPFEELDRRAAPRNVLVAGSTPITTDPELQQAPLLAWLKGHILDTGEAIRVFTDELPRHWVRHEALCPIAAVPLFTQGRVCGMLVVVGLLDHEPHPIHAAQMQLLSAIGHQVSIAIENVRLSAEVTEIEMLRELDRMRSELIASFSHDLRTPLGLIKMGCTTLQREDVSLAPDVVKDLLTDIETQTDRLARLVDSTLDLGQLESGKLTLRRVAFDLHQLLRRLTAQTERAHPSHRVRLELDTEATLAWGDPERIEQVIYNLIDNAIKYSPDADRITVRVARQGHCIALSIQDHGVGIPEEERELIFERFYRIQSPLTRRVAGTGLGLATCKGIVEAHGGSIWVENDHHAEGGASPGTTMTFTLPAYHADD